MASPRTRRVLAEIKPKDENTVSEFDYTVSLIEKELSTPAVAREVGRNLQVKAKSSRPSLCITKLGCGDLLWVWHLDRSNISYKFKLCSIECDWEWFLITLGNTIPLS